MRAPAQSLVHGITQADLGIPDWALAQQQFEAYVAALAACGLQVTLLAADENCPDCVFIEDTALVTPELAIITRPGAASRRPEVPAVAACLAERFAKVVTVEAPGTVDAGDIMNVGGYHFIGLSARTNVEGAEQMLAALRSVGLDGQMVSMPEILHFKTGINYLADGQVIAAAGFLAFLRDVDDFPLRAFEVLEVPDEEAYAANALWLNDRVLVAAGFPQTEALLQAAGYATVSLDVSEFRKLEGGLSCLSLRF